MTRRLHALLPCALTALALLGGCVAEEPGKSSAIVIRNGSSTTLGRVMINGVDHGSLGPGSVLTLDDVGAASFLIQVYRPGDAAPCDAVQTAVLERGENLHHTFTCATP